MPDGTIYATGRDNTERKRAEEELRQTAAELELARLLTEITGRTVRRKLGAGRSDDTGDLEGVPDTTIEVKNYKDLTRAISDGLADLEREQANAGAANGVLFCRRRGGKWIAVMTPEQWASHVR